MLWLRLSSREQPSSGASVMRSTSSDATAGVELQYLCGDPAPDAAIVNRQAPHTREHVESLNRRGGEAASRAFQ